MAYEMPPTDPRVLVATEDEVLVDLMVLMHHAKERKKLMDPKGAKADELQENVDRIRDGLKGLKESATTGGLRERILRFERATDPDQKRRGRMMSLTVGDGGFKAER